MIKTTYDRLTDLLISAGEKWASSKEPEAAKQEFEQVAKAVGKIVSRSDELITNILERQLHEPLVLRQFSPPEIAKLERKADYLDTIKQHPWIFIRDLLRGRFRLEKDIYDK